MTTLCRYSLIYNWTITCRELAFKQVSVRYMKCLAKLVNSSKRRFSRSSFIVGNAGSVYSENIGKLLLSIAHVFSCFFYFYSKTHFNSPKNKKCAAEATHKKYMTPLLQHKSIPHKACESEPVFLSEDKNTHLMWAVLDLCCDIIISFHKWKIQPYLYFSSDKKLQTSSFAAKSVYKCNNAGCKFYNRTEYYYVSSFLCGYHFFI